MEAHAAAMFPPNPKCINASQPSSAIFKRNERPPSWIPQAYINNIHSICLICSLSMIIFSAASHCLG